MREGGRNGRKSRQKVLGLENGLIFNYIWVVGSYSRVGELLKGDLRFAVGGKKKRHGGLLKEKSEAKKKTQIDC